MIQALRSLGHNQFEWAKWFPTKDKNDFKKIQVEIVNENEKRWSTVLQNIITTADSTLIRTAYAHDYKNRQHIFYRDKWWEIISVGEVATDIAPQVMSLVKPKSLFKYVIEIHEEKDEP